MTSYSMGRQNESLGLWCAMCKVCSIYIVSQKGGMGQSGISQVFETVPLGKYVVFLCSAEILTFIHLQYLPWNCRKHRQISGGCVAVDQESVNCWGTANVSGFLQYIPFLTPMGLWTLLGLLICEAIIAVNCGTQYNAVQTKSLPTWFHLQYWGQVAFGGSRILFWGSGNAFCMIILFE